MVSCATWSKNLERTLAYIAYCLKTKKFGSWITWLSLSCLIFHHCPEDFERELSKIESKNVWDKKYVDLDGEQFFKKRKSQDKIWCQYFLIQKNFLVKLSKGLEGLDHVKSNWS